MTFFPKHGQGKNKTFFFLVSWNQTAFCGVFEPQNSQSSMLVVRGKMGRTDVLWGEKREPPKPNPSGNSERAGQVLPSCGSMEGGGGQLIYGSSWDVCSRNNLLTDGRELVEEFVMKEDKLIVWIPGLQQDLKLTVESKKT